MLSLEATRNIAAWESEPRIRTATTSSFVRAALGIKDALLAQIRQARDGSLYWRHPTRPRSAVRPTPLGPHIFPGTLGVVLFLASAGRILKDGSLLELTRQAILPLRRQLRELELDPVRAGELRHPLGGLTGFGSLIYGLTRLGDLLGDDSLYADALAASTLVTRERIEADECYDVMLGSAGALLGLLALDERLPAKNASGSTPYELASLCAGHLAERRRSWGELDDIWLTAEGQPLQAGFCHGAAGIASALARFAAREKSDLWLDLVERSLGYERSLFSRAAGNWRLSAQGEPRFYNGWCKGAPGIGLGRLTMRGQGFDGLLDEEIETAFRTTASPFLSTSDSLCCGNAGRVDVLVQAYRALHDREHLRAARRLAGELIERARETGSYGLFLEGEIVLDVRLFPGLAGIGYALLRASAPHRLPCLLSME